MKKLRSILLIIVTVLPIAIWAQCGGCPVSKDCETTTNGSVGSKPETRKLAGYNKVNWINENYYFTYDFAKKPKMGTTILRVKVYNKTKKISNVFDVYADADMPSMRGAHATGDIKLKPNKKGELLVPVNFVMPGVWQVDLKFKKDSKSIFEGSFQLKI